MQDKHLWLIFRGVLLAATGAVVAYLGHEATCGDTLGTYGPLVAAACTALTDVLHTLSAAKPAERDGVEERPEEKQ